MSATLEKHIENAVTYGRACVRIVEAANVLLEREPGWIEWLLLKLVRKVYTHRLRGLVVALPSDITQQILAASEKLMGIERGFSNN